ncbi:MAG: serine/threonine protein kinase [Gemmataceae bacterium]|nr:serine/threonine protein kinase [Gemmataceae bacterium]
MPLAPSSVADFLVMVRQSGLIEEAVLGDYLERLRATGTTPSDPRLLAGLMIRDHLLTQFQAEQILVGRWRRFFIGRYKILEQIASGGMGYVYLGEHLHMRRRAAIKVLPLAQAVNPAVLERFRREGRAIAALNHPNIVRAYDIDQDQNLHFLAMEYVEGTTLNDLVKLQGPLSVLQAMHYMRQAASGLQHAFEATLVHRDIKPGNLLVDLSGTVKILDLGLARFYLDDTDDLSIKYDELVLGTADFVAPEQAENSHDADIRADIYSLGCTFYFCLAGHPPFPAGTVAQKVLAQLKQTPRPIREIRPDVSKEFAAILERAMAKRPKHRYQSPAELVDALTNVLLLSGETAVGGMGRTLTESSRWRQQQLESQRRRWFRRAVGAGIALVGGGIAALTALLSRGKKQPPTGPGKRVAATGESVQL